MPKECREKGGVKVVKKKGIKKEEDAKPKKNKKRVGACQNKESRVIKVKRKGKKDWD